MMDFLKRKGVTLSPKDYFIKALSYMALGLFSSLIIGLIIKTTGEQLGVEQLEEIGTYAMGLTGPAIGVAIAYGLGAPPLVLFAALFAGGFIYPDAGPAGSYVAALVATEIGKIVYKETKVDIIVTPFVTIVTGYLVGISIGPPISAFMTWFGSIINWSTDQQPIIMGIIVAVLMGWALTAPISSLAIAVMLELSGIAAGAATVGCAAQMIGFAVSSYRDNGFGGFIAQGIGTSMLQVANIVKKPVIIIPPTIAGAVLAPFATTLFNMTNNELGAGMGTSGLVGQIMTLQTMGFSYAVFGVILLLHIIGPAIISLAVSEWFRKKNWIKPGDMKIKYD